ncbi:MAG: ABC transporter ATP-binding protein [Paraclostridium sordellii]
MIKLKNIGKMYSSKFVLENINLDIKSNTIIGLVGENGAGKSTIMKIITGLIRNYRGEKIITQNNFKIGALIDGPSFYKNYDARTNLEYLGAYNNINNCEIDYIFNLLNLNEFGNKPYSKYSLGMRQRLGIGFTLLGNPNLLVLDEPFNGLDPKQVYQIVDILKKWKQETHGSILISSHILSQLDMLCDSVIFIDKGKIVKKIDMNEYKNTSIYRVILSDKNEDLYNYLIKNKIKILECIENKNYKIEVDSDNNIIKYINKNFEVDELYREKQTLEDIYRKVEGIN